MALLSAEQMEQMGKIPISAEMPAGESIRLEPIFESIEAEVAKLDDFTSKEPVRWKQVAEGAQKILTEESKDFLVACYLTRSLCEEDLLQGLSQGVQVARSMVEQFWDVAHPPKKRARGRSQAFEWLVEKCNPLLESYQPRQTDFEAISQLETNVIALDDYLIDKMADKAPNFAEFRQMFRRLRQGLEAEKQQAESKTATSKTTQAPSTPNRPSPTSSILSAPAAPSSVGCDKDLIAVYRTTQEQLRSVTQYLSSNNSADAEIFRINRFITWLGVNQMPPATAGKTQLRPLAKDKLEAYQAMYQEKRWQDLLPEIEQSLVRAPFWLDGQKMVADALEDLDNTLALSAVIDGVRAFVNRIPGVLNGRFSDDSPFACDATKQWINQSVMTSGSGQSAEALSIDTAHLSKDWEQAYGEAVELAKQKQTRQALALFQEGVARSTSKREQTLWQFNQARFCFEQGLQQLALPILENIDASLTNSGASDWEPQLTKQVLQLLLRCYQLQEGTAMTEEKTKVLHARLCQLDLAMAFDLVKH